MAEAQDILKSDPIETLDRASKINLLGGGVLIALVCVAVYCNQKNSWSIDKWLIFSALVAAVLLALAGTLARMYDVRRRVKLALKLLDVAGTSDAAEAGKADQADKEKAKATGLSGDDIKALLDRLLSSDKPLASYILQPQDQQVDLTDKAQQHKPVAVMFLS